MRRQKGTAKEEQRQIQESMASVAPIFLLRIGYKYMPLDYTFHVPFQFTVHEKGALPGTTNVKYPLYYAQSRILHGELDPYNHSLCCTYI